MAQAASRKKMEESKEQQQQQQLKKDGFINRSEQRDSAAGEDLGAC